MRKLWYETSATLDGTLYPSATTSEFTIGAVQDGDWFNFTVNVETAGTYSLSSTWASGNGPPGGEGGNGDMGLEVFSNGTMLATWTAVFPNYEMYADFRHWRAYPSFATITLVAGPQIIKLQSGAKHLQLDYVQFDLAEPDGGLESGDAANGGNSGGGSVAASGAGGGSGSIATSGNTAGSGSIANSGTAATSGDTGASGWVVTSGSTTPGGGAATGGSANGSGEAASVGPTSAGNAGATEAGTHGSSCSVGSASRSSEGWLAMSVALGLVARGRRARSSRPSCLSVRMRAPHGSFPRRPTRSGGSQWGR
jgi:hypothetical protein